MKKLLLIIPFILASCNNGMKPERISKYNGGVILEKSNITDYKYYTIEYNSGIIDIKVYAIDFKYNVGDTIK